MRRRARGFSVVVASALASLVVGVQAVSGNVLWTMGASPATAVVGGQTTFTFTATNLDPLLGVKCVVVEIPASIVPGESWISGSSTSASWTTFRSGQLLTAVINTGDGNEKLVVGEWVSFAVAAVPTQVGTYAFHAIAYSGHECLNGARTLATPPVVLVSEQAVPELTPAPTPTPTPTPTPEAILPPISTLPPIVATPTPQSQTVTTPGPAATPTPSPSPSALVSTGPSPAAQATPSIQVPLLGAGPPSAAPRVRPVDAADTAALEIARAERSTEEARDVSLGPLGVMDGLSVWAIPGAVVGGPGVLVI